MNAKNILRSIAIASLPIAMSAAMLAGCESSDDHAGDYWTTETKSKPAASTSSGTSSKPSSSSSSSSSGSRESSGSSSESAATEGAADQVPFGSLHWKFGGVNGARAKKTSASIGGLSVGARSLSYRWTGPTLRSWGLSDGNPGAYACFFVMKADGTWVGGKFDWISTSRTSRGFENIMSGYGGWSLAGVPNPCACAFVIVSSDCKRRTNVIAGRWSR